VDKGAINKGKKLAEKVKLKDWKLFRFEGFGEVRERYRRG
jgi:hypothetical protein